LKISARDFGKSALLISIFCLIFLDGIPMYSGPVANYMQPVSIPSSYLDAKAYLQRAVEAQGSTFRVAVLPLTVVGGFVQYNWSQTQMPDIAGQFSPVPVIQDVPGVQLIGVEGKVASFLENRNTSLALDYLSVLNVQYLLIHKDITNFSWQMTKSDLEGHNVTSVLDSKELAIYRLERKPFPIAFTSGLDDISLISATAENHSADLTSAAYVQPMPYSYVIQTQNSTSGILFLNLAYSSDWRIYVGKQDLIGELWSKPLPVTHVSGMNGSFNEWDLRGYSGQTVTVVYWPFVLTFLGLLVSTLGFLSALLIVSARGAIRSGSVRISIIRRRTTGEPKS
jgi:hypothetical protein